MLEKIKRVVQNNPDNIAYQYKDEGITYKDLWSCAFEKAVFLKKQGIEPVIIYGHKSIDMIVSMLSCIIAKRAYIPVDTCTPLDRILKIINITNASLLICNEDINISDIAKSSLQELSQYDHLDLKESKNEVVYIIFTSGSTGVPKGVPISNNNLTNFVEWISSLSPLNSYKNANVLNQASFSFDLSVADLFYSLCNGHTLIALDKEAQEDYNEMFRVIKNNHINFCVMTPTFMKLCMINKDFNEENFDSIKCIYFCGEPLEKKVVGKIFSLFPNIRILNAYGPTEATSAVSAIEITKEMLEKEELLPVGWIDHCATSVEISENEIILKGNSVFDGYLGGIVGGYYSENGINCYKTGDLGYISDHKLYCSGRADSQIKYKGYRIELNDIENNLKNVNGVMDCAVIAKYNNYGIVKQIKAFVVLEREYTVELIRQELIKRIPRYMVPNQIKSIAKLPLNCNFKIDRKKLSEL